MVTPRVIDDEQGGVFSYGYRPATKEASDPIDAEQFLNQGSIGENARRAIGARA